MNRSMLSVIPVVLSASFASGVCGDLIPTPDFSEHPIPTTEVPGAAGQWRIDLDVALLFGALCLSSYFALVSRSRLKLLVLSVASLVWFGFVRGGCVCAIGATQNVALAAVDSSYVVPVSVIAFFVLPLVFTLFFGRTFCASVCPLGAVQELVSVLSVRVPSWLDQALGLLAYIYLGAAVILAATNTAFIICRYDPFVAFFRLSGSAPMLMFGGCVLAVGVFVGRPYCRYLCPYGAILRVLSRFSKWHVRIPPSSCINCHLCEDVCPYDAIQGPTAPQSEREVARGRRRLVRMLLLAPALVVVGGIVGSLSGEPLARWHREVRLAEQLRQDELGLTSETTIAADAWRSAGRPAHEAYAAAVGVRRDFRRLGVWLGAWTGLVIAARLIQLSLRRPRHEYQPSRSGCVSCGRCFWYCPVEQVRLGLITDVQEVVTEAEQ